MSNHTPGPWRRNVEGRNEDAWRVVSESKATGYIAFIPPQHENAEANSRLIAAAPSLLEALKNTLDALYNETHGEDDTSYVREVKADARAAIAKAEGSSS